MFSEKDADENTGQESNEDFVEELMGGHLIESKSKCEYQNPKQSLISKSKASNAHEASFHLEIVANSVLRILFLAPLARRVLLWRIRAEPRARFCQIARKEIFDFGLAKAFGKKRVSEIPPLLISDHCDLGDVFIMLGQECDIAQSGSRFQPRKFSKMNSALILPQRRIASRAAACIWLTSDLPSSPLIFALITSGCVNNGKCHCASA